MVIRIIKFILLGYLVAFCQTILSNLTAILGIAPDYSTIIIVLIVLRREFPVSYPAVFLVGMVADALNPELLGLGTAVRFAIAVAVYEISRQVNTEQLHARLYLLIGAELCFQILYQMVANSFDFDLLRRIYLEVSLPTLVYTTAVGFVMLILSDLKFKIEVTRRAIG